MRFFVLTVITLLIFSNNIFSQSPQNIVWLSLEEAIEKQKENPKKIILDAYTDWCGWCKRMDQVTFSNPEIAQYINTYYYAVKFNAETTDTIRYRGKTYVNSQAGKVDANGRPVRRPTHQLAYELMGQRMSFPTIVYLDDSAKVIAPIGGYYSPQDIQPILIYFAENLHLSANLQDFINDFNKTFVDSLKPQTQNIKWLTVQEALEKQAKEPRKLLISFDAPWGTTAKMMQSISFNDTAVARYVNENMYPVKFNIISQDSVVFGGYTFKNQSTEHPYHDFGVQLLNGNMKLPAHVFVAEDLRPITSVPGYFSSQSLAPVLHYFNEDYYKNTQWPVFQSQYPAILQNNK